MRITVSGSHLPLTNDQRAYAEYRFFTVIARHDALVRAVNIAVRRDSAADRPFFCTVTVDLGSSGTIKTQARAAHLGAALDRAADRTAWLLGRRVTRATRSA